MGPNDMLSFETWWDNNPTADVGNRSCLITFGGTSNYVMNEGLSAAIAAYHGNVMICNDGAINSQFVSGLGYAGDLGGFQRSTAADNTYAVDTSADVSILFRADLFVAGDTITMKRSEIRLHRWA